MMLSQWMGQTGEMPRIGNGNIGNVREMLLRWGWVYDRSLHPAA